MRGVLEEIRSKGAELIVIGNGPVQFAEAFKKDLDFDGPLYTDPSLKTYRAAELKRGLFTSASLKTIPAAFRALSKGHVQTLTRGDALQLGGAIVVSKEGELRYRQASEYAGDHAPLDRLLAAI